MEDDWLTAAGGEPIIIHEALNTDSSSESEIPINKYNKSTFKWETELADLSECSIEDDEDSCSDDSDSDSDDDSSLEQEI